jgi:hypothetical protein
LPRPARQRGRAQQPAIPMNQPSQNPHTGPAFTRKATGFRNGNRLPFLQRNGPPPGHDLLVLGAQPDLSPAAKPALWPKPGRRP